MAAQELELNRSDPGKRFLSESVRSFYSDSKAAGCVALRQRDRLQVSRRHMRAERQAALEMVASERVELSHPCEYRNLNPARLPIPPRGQWLQCHKVTYGA